MKRLSTCLYGTFDVSLYCLASIPLSGATHYLFGWCCLTWSYSLLSWEIEAQICEIKIQIKVADSRPF